MVEDGEEFRDSLDGLYNNIALKSSYSGYTDGFNFSHLNAGSLPAHFEEFKNLVLNVPFHIIAVTETWLTAQRNDNEIYLGGYKVIRNDRNRSDRSRGGGTLLYVAQALDYKVLLKSPPQSEVEYIFVEVKNNLGQILLFGVVYNPPGTDCVDVLMPIFSDFSSRYSKLIVVGDFNVNMLLNHGYSLKFRDMIESMNISNFSNFPTNFQGTSSTLIDLTLTNSRDSVIMHSQINGLCSHDLIYGIFDFCCAASSSFDTFIGRRLDRINLTELQSQTFLTNWEEIYNMADVNDQLTFFNGTVMGLLDKFAPEVEIRVSRDRNLFKFSSSLERLCNIKNYYLNRWRKNRNLEDRSLFKSSLNAFNKQLHSERAQYNLKRYNPKLDTKTLFRNLKNDGVLQSKSFQVQFEPDKLNNYFVYGDQSGGEVGSDSVQTDLDSSGGSVLATDYGESDSEEYFSATSDSELSDLLGADEFSFRNVELDEVFKIVSNISSNARGVDGIPIQFIKLILPIVLPFLTHLINSCLTKSVFPDDWKKARVTPIPKVKNPTLSDFRSISILPSLSKVLETVMKQQLSDHFESKGLLSIFQSGFRHAHSTNTCLSKISDDFSKDIEEGKVSFLVLVDFRKAFGSVVHSILLTRLRLEFGLSSSALRLVASFLTNRHQAVRVGHAESEFLTVGKGVPEGSILGPLLFSCFINNLPDSQGDVSKHIFADDYQIYLSDFPENTTACINKLNNELKKIEEWAERSQIKINAQKTQVCYFTNKRNFDVSALPNLTFNNSILPYKTSVKNLGLIFSTDLRWREHVNMVSSSVFGILSRLWACTKFLPTEIRRRLVVSLIVPRFTYCASIYAGTYRGSWDRLNNVFNACARYIYRKTKREHISEFTFKILNSTLENYFTYLQCSLIHKIVYGECPSYLKDCILPRQSVRTKGLKVPKAVSSARSNSLFVLGVSRYNSLSNEARGTVSANTFRRICFNQVCCADGHP